MSGKPALRGLEYVWLVRMRRRGVAQAVTAALSRVVGAQAVQSGPTGYDWYGGGEPPDAVSVIGEDGDSLEVILQVGAPTELRHAAREVVRCFVESGGVVIDEPDLPIDAP